jgi:hypothetical protein
MNRRLGEHRIAQRRAAPLLVLIAALFAGCKAKPAQPAGFADESLMAHDRSVPFDRFWRKPGVELARYKQLYVADVNTAYMLQQTDWQKGERKQQIEQDVQALRVRTRDALVKAFREDPNHRFTVVDTPTNAPDALIFEMALIEVVPSKVTLNALGYAPFGVGLTLNALRTIGNDKSTCAFESRTRDASTGEILMLAADREAEQMAIVDLRGLTWYSHVDGIVKDWAKQFVQVANQKPGQVIKDTSKFRLQPW